MDRTIRLVRMTLDLFGPPPDAVISLPDAVDVVGRAEGEHGRAAVEGSRTREEQEISEGEIAAGDLKNSGIALDDCEAAEGVLLLLVRMAATCTTSTLIFIFMDGMCRSSGTGSHCGIFFP